MGEGYENRLAWKTNSNKAHLSEGPCMSQENLLNILYISVDNIDVWAVVLV